MATAVCVTAHEERPRQGRIPLMLMALLVTGCASTGNQSQRSNQTSPMRSINVKDFGARGDAATDDTRSLQDALDAGVGGEVVIPPGTYLIGGDTDTAHRDIEGGGLAVRSRTQVFMSKGAVLKADRSMSPNYKLLRVPGTSEGVTITGSGVIEGDRDDHDYGGAGGGSHEWGYCLAILGPAANVVIEGITVKDCTGDGISIHDDGSPEHRRPSGIVIRRVTATHNRRNNLSIVGVDGLRIEGCTFSNAGGTAPQAGVDMEPGGFGHSIRDVVVKDTIATGNAGRGLALDGTGVGDIKDVQILSNALSNNGDAGISLYRVEEGDVVIARNELSGNGLQGMFALNVSGVSLVANRIVGNSQSVDGGAAGIHVQNSRHVSIEGNCIRRGEGKKQSYGLLISNSTGLEIRNNDLRQGGRDGEFHAYRSEGVAPPEPGGESSATPACSIK